VNDQEAWIARNARRRRALADPAVGAGAALLGPVASSERGGWSGPARACGVAGPLALLEEDEHEP
jgi:hypothetical protein